MKPLLLVAALLATPLFAADPVRVTVLPAVPLIEEGKSGQLLNFDFLLENGGSETLEIAEIEMTLLGPDDALVLQRRLGSNGDSIATVPNRVLEPGKKLVVFNPFPDFEPELELTKLRYDITFANDTKTTVLVTPRPYRTKTPLIVPVPGRSFVHDGHDALSHHRRLDVTGGMTTALGITSNMTRYASDFCVTDAKGKMWKTDGAKPEDWYGFGTPIVAPGDGVVVRASDGMADNVKGGPPAFTMDEVLKNVWLVFGNVVVIDHGNGEFSSLAHMKKGSIAVKTGDRVKQGQAIGAMGMSGDAFLVHLHYQLQSDANFGEGLPSTFHNFKRLTGKGFVDVRRGQIDSGDVIR